MTTKKVLCTECKRKEAMPKLPRLEVQVMCMDEDDREQDVEVVEILQVERREAEIRRRLRRIWVAETTEEKDRIVEEILDRMEED